MQEYINNILKYSLFLLITSTSVIEWCVQLSFMVIKCDKLNWKKWIVLSNLGILELMYIRTVKIL